jgi:hypothetical protein
VEAGRVDFDEGDEDVSRLEPELVDERVADGAQHPGDDVGRPHAREHGRIGGCVSAGCTAGATPPSA